MGKDVTYQSKARKNQVRCQQCRHYRRPRYGGLGICVRVQPNYLMAPCVGMNGTCAHADLPSADKAQGAEAVKA